MTNQNKETKEAQGEGISPDISFAKTLAIQNATSKIATSISPDGKEFIITNTIIIDEKLFQNEDGTYKYVVTVRATVTPVENQNEVYIVEKYIAPEPQVESKPTPQQVNEQTQKESDKKAEQQVVTDTTTTDAKVTQQNTPPNLKAQGQDKLALVLNKKRSEIKRILIPIALGLAAKAGIKFVNGLKPQLPDFCLPKEEVDRILFARNQIVNRLNNIVKTLNTLTKVLTGLSLIITIVATLVKTLKNSRKAASLAVKFIPSPPGTPGFVTSTLSDLKDIQETAYTRLIKIAGAIAAISLSISILNNVLLKIIAILNAIDAYLIKCSSEPPQLVPLDQTLIDLENINNQIESNEEVFVETYNGFILEIVEEPYSPTVNRRKAVAKNQNGIILLSTPLSFTTDNQTLLDLIKLLIDSNNLKAD